MTKNTKKLILRLFLASVLITSCLLLGVPLIFGKKDEETALAEAFIQNSPDNLERKLAISEENSLISSVSPNNPEPKVAKKIKVVATAYSSSVFETDESPFFTASGSHVRDGTMASNSFPFGTRVRIPEIYGDKIFVVEDRLNPRVGPNHIDVWFPSYKEALNFGRKDVFIEILE